MTPDVSSFFLLHGFRFCENGYNDIWYFYFILFRSCESGHNDIRCFFLVNSDYMKSAKMVSVISFLSIQII